MQYLTLTELKNLLNETSSDYDNYLTALADSAESYFELLIDKTLISDGENIVERHDGGWVLYLKRVPVRSVSEVASNANSDDPTAIDPTEYEIENNQIHFKTSIYRNELRNLKVTYLAGYDSADTESPTYPVPANIKLIISQMVGAMFDPDQKALGGMESEKIEDYSYKLNSKKLDDTLNSPLFASVVSSYQYYEF